jgi:hypothetical protein
MPFAGYENFEVCVVDQKGKGHSEKSARKICGFLQKKYEARQGKATRLDAMTTDGVERSDPSGPPSAFRIWKAGVNITDHGNTVFSDRSAELLMAQQAARGNRFPIDVDHLSLNVEAPLESRRAVGWFSIDVRDGELWAVDVEWSDTVKAGLVKEPPEWRYHSPAYDQDAETGEVTCLLNLAITNLPATHEVTALASRRLKESRMTTKAKKATWADLKAAIDGDDENAKAEAYATIQAAFPNEEPDGDEKKDDAADGDPEKDTEEPKEVKKDAEPDGDEKKDPEADASVVASLDTALRAANARIAALEAKNESSERASILASREISPALAKVLAAKPIAVVREICNTLPKKAEKKAPVSTEHVQATRGAQNQKERAPRLSPEEKKALDLRMGLRKHEDSIRWEGTHRVFPVFASLALAKAEVKSNG